MNVDRFFVDTNIFVYAKMDNEQEIDKHRFAVRFLENLYGDAVISTQVVNEFSSALIRHGVEDRIIRRAVEAMADECFVSSVSMKTVQDAWHIRGIYHYSYWDCLIIASALENRCSILITEDLQHHQVIEGRLKIVNPFLVPQPSPSIT